MLLMQPDVKRLDLIVGAGATSHIITDMATFKQFNRSFQAGTHCIEFAESSRSNGVAKGRGDADVWLHDSTT